MSNKIEKSIVNSLEEIKLIQEGKKDKNSLLEVIHKLKSEVKNMYLTQLNNLFYEVLKLQQEGVIDLDKYPALLDAMNNANEALNKEV